jgi:DNA ligase
MPDLQDGETAEVKGSAAKPYVLKNVGGVYSCNCPAWRNQSLPIERRTCKHLRQFRGDEAEDTRIGAAVAAAAASPATPAKKSGPKSGAPPLLLAESWNSAADLTGWWMSEKLDGVRAYWDGKVLISRLGNVFHAPDWFVAKLPDVPLDGELWLDRKKFSQTISIVKRQDRSDHWKQVSFVVFDAPALDDPFEKRVRFLEEFFARDRLPYARPHQHEPCKSIEHLKAELSRVEALGGEGLMMRQPGSKYESGRSSTLLKIKTFHDAEARVIGHLAGKGRHKGRLGALEVEMNGVRFSVGTGFSDAQRENPPSIGSVITFRYQELSGVGVPRFPSFVRAGASTSASTNVPTTPTMGTPFSVSVIVSAAVPAPTLPIQVPPTPASVPAGITSRYFEFVGGTSAKFWEAFTEGNAMTTRWGRIGSAGRATTTTFGDAAGAQAAMDKLIAEKTREGYVEKTGEES